MKKSWIIIAIIVVGGIVWFAASRDSAQVTDNIQPDNSRSAAQSDTGKSGVNVGDQALDFTIKELDGREIKLSDLRGRYVLFAFMATWCVPCQIEADNARKVQEENDLVVIQIDVDARENEQDLIKFKQEFGREDWLMAFDKSFTIAEPYKVKSFDTTLVVDPEGKIIYRDEGWPVDVKTLGDLFLPQESRAEVPESEIVSRGGIHWHPELKIVIKGEEIPIPANIGIGPQYASNPLYDRMMQMTNMHTHDGSGKIHWEVMQGPVKKEDMHLGLFFDIWGKKFNNSCIFDSCNGSEGTVKLLVNGQPNIEFQNYTIQDGDKIEIQYE